MTETTARIRWRDDLSRGETLGSVGTFGRPVFRIWPPDQNGDRVLLVYLAGEAQHMYHDDSKDAESALKAKAEELLAGFVSSLGAVFAEKRICPSCYGGGTDGSVNRNDCPACSGTGNVLRVPETTAATTAREKD